MLPSLKTVPERECSRSLALSVPNGTERQKARYHRSIRVSAWIDDTGLLGVGTDGAQGLPAKGMAQLN